MTQPSREKSLALIALFAALIAVLGLIPKVTLPFGVPITAQSLGIMLCGLVLGSKRGGLAVLLFLALVAVGLPLLSGGRGGLGAFTAPPAGFLIGFPFAAFVTGLIVEKWRGPPLWVSAFIASIIGGIVVLYMFGIVGLSIILDKSLVEAAGFVTVFILGDVIKAIIGSILLITLMNIRPQSILSRL